MLIVDMGPGGCGNICREIHLSRPVQEIQFGVQAGIEARFSAAQGSRCLLQLLVLDDDWGEEMGYLEYRSCVFYLCLQTSMTSVAFSAAIVVMPPFTSSLDVP